MSDLTQSHPACCRKSPLRSDTVFVFSYDHATLQVIRDFLEPLGFSVEVAPAYDVNPVAIAYRL